MKRSDKICFLLYLLFTAVTFMWLCMAKEAALGVPVFVLAQIAFAVFYVLHKKLPRAWALWGFAPVFVLSLNAFTSASGLWRWPNFFVMLALSAAIGLALNGSLGLKKGAPLAFLGRVIAGLFRPFGYIGAPFRWLSEEKFKTKYVKKVLLGVIIALPFLLVLVLVLSSADAVFAQKAINLGFDLLAAFHLATFLKWVGAIAMAFYLFGLFMMALFPKPKPQLPLQQQAPVPVVEKTRDNTVYFVFLLCILLVYTCFVFIQVKYLFAGAALPEGMTYAGYARQGFFQLFFLTFVNVFLVLFGVWRAGEQNGVWDKLVRAENIYLCAVTLVLLASSFYKMSLYAQDDGFTRMRVLVFGFLIFQAAGLLLTLFYALRPKFNIAACYAALALCYYLVLNVGNLDAVVAKNQIDRYFAGDKSGIAYVTTLSPDAAGQIARLLTAPEADEEARGLATRYFNKFAARQDKAPKSWQSLNLANLRASKAYDAAAGQSAK